MNIQISTGKEFSSEILGLLIHLAVQKEVHIKLNRSFMTDDLYAQLLPILKNLGFTDIDAKNILGNIRLVKKYISDEQPLIEFRELSEEETIAYTLEYDKRIYPFELILLPTQIPFIQLKDDIDNHALDQLRAYFEPLSIPIQSAAKEVLSEESIVNTYILAKDRFSKKLGIKLRSISNGELQLVIKVKKYMLNAFGIVHNGVLYSLAETTLSCISNSSGYKCIAIESNMSIHQSTQKGDLLIASSQELFRSNKLAKYAINIRNQHDVLVASYSGTVYCSMEAWQSDAKL